jgi:hypothetical protein
MRSIIAALQSKFPIRLEPGPDGMPLPGRQARSPTAVSGWTAIVIALPVVVVGLACLGIAAGYIPIKASGARQAPSWIFGVFGAVLAWAAISSGVHGARGLQQSARRDRLRSAHPDEPWRWDHTWDERGSTDDTSDRAGSLLVGAFVMLVFMAPFHWIGFVAGRGLVMFGVIALLFDAVALALIARAVYLLMRRWKYGRTRARFARFPFRPGSTVEIHVEAPVALPQHAVVTATLRCVQERYVRSGTGEEASLSVACYEKYRDVTPAPFASTAGGGRALRVRFELPRDVPSTDLSSRACRYWELEVEAATDGVDYRARYLVPVY